MTGGGYQKYLDRLHYILITIVICNQVRQSVAMNQLDPRATQHHISTNQPVYKQSSMVYLLGFCLRFQQNIE